MSDPAPDPAAAADRPVFVIGERPAAMQLVEALGDTATLCAMPPTRLLSDLVAAVDRCVRGLRSRTALAAEGLRPAAWYRQVQLAQLRRSGKQRTVEFSGLSILRLCELFPAAQFVVVRQLSRPMPRSRRLPALPPVRILQIDSRAVADPETFERVLAFLGEPGPAMELDLSDRATTTASPVIPPDWG